MSPRPRGDGRKSVVVVKSLGKARTIGRYLGFGYKVLATDPTRRGEAIAWQLLAWRAEREAVGDSPVQRVAFHGVTSQLVRTALVTPRDLDMDLV